MTDLVVFIEGARAGEVASVGKGDRSAMFRYDQDYLIGGRNTPLSLSAPLDRMDHDISGWLDGLLPDNVEVRRRWAVRNGARSAMTMDLLGSPIGLDCAGAVQFCRPGDEGSLESRASGLEPKSEHDVAEWIRQARRDWSSWEGLGSRGQFSLAGAQAKCVAHWDGSQWCAPYGNMPTTHILKPGVAGHTDAEVVEHVCLAAARRLGLDAAETELARFESERVLVVTRFDRRRVGGVLRRQHHEDLCQALGLRPAQKYQIDGGPTPRQVSDLIFQESSDRREDRQRFCDALIFNWAIAAPDAHAKNYSLMLDGPDVRLAPLYDVSSFLPYSTGNPRAVGLAMSVGQDRTWSAMSNTDAWAATAQAMLLDVDATVDRVADITRRVPSAISDTIDGLSAGDRGSRALPYLHRLVKLLSDEALGVFARDRMRAPSNDGEASGGGSVSSDAMNCGAPLPGGGTCDRQVRTKPCPHHPGSTGSRAISDS